MFGLFLRRNGNRRDLSSSAINPPYGPSGLDDRDKPGHDS
jgi:hypothetical protein